MMEGGSPIDASDGPGPMIRSCIMPAEHWEIRDTWHTSGLKCTGSHDVALTDVLVPDENFFGFPFGISFGGRRAASQRQPRVVRRKLRPGQPASHQRPVRLPSLARAGTGDRGPPPIGRDRVGLFPGDSSGATVPRMQPLLLHQMPRTLEIAIRAVARRGVLVVGIPCSAPRAFANRAPWRQDLLPSPAQ